MNRIHSTVCVARSGCGHARLRSLARSRQLTLFCALLTGVGIPGTAAAGSVAYQVTDLGTFGGNFSQAFGINASGQVTGWASTTGGERHAFLYDGSMHDLGTFIGFNSAGYGINAGGQVTGQDDYGHTFLWTPTTPNGASGMMTGLVNASNAQGINASGQVSGYFVTNDLGTTHAFVWTPTTPNGAHGTLHDLGTLGGNESNAQGINDSGLVTGWASTPGDLVNHAMLYDTVHGMVDLNSLIDPRSGWELTNGIAINDAGQITGFGTIGGETHAFLLTSVPHILPGDANGDGVVNFTDLLILAQNYSKAGGLAQGDFNADGSVGFDDLLILAQHYGEGAAAVAGPVPEPSSAAAAVGLAAAGLWRGRRRLNGVV